MKGALRLGGWLMMRMVFLMLIIAGWASPALADDIKAASRSVVRVVVIAISDGEIVGFGHGSGFAVSSDRIITNAHVVALATRYPDNVVIGVVPSEGEGSYPANLVSVDSSKDLALLQIAGGSLPPIPLYTGPLEEGSDVVALGYPGNVDAATAQSARDYIEPAAPTRSAGNYSNERTVEGIVALLHTASIARGNSGGPLMDKCGRVVGVNTFLTGAEDGDASFGFAIANRELASFLRNAQQKFSSVSGQCVSMVERLREEEERESARDLAAKAADRRQLASAREKVLADAKASNEDARENRAVLAIILGTLGLAGLGGSGLYLAKDKPVGAAVFAGAATLILGVAGWSFFSRPARADLKIETDFRTRLAGGKIEAGSGDYICQYRPERSRITVSTVEDIRLTWSDSGCMNGRTQYANQGKTWFRVLVPRGEATASVLEFQPSTKEHIVLRYLLGRSAMDRVREHRSKIKLKACTADPSALALLDEEQNEIRASLPDIPNERIVYSCAKA